MSQKEKAKPKLKQRSKIEPEEKQTKLKKIRFKFKNFKTLKLKQKFPLILVCLVTVSLIVNIVQAVAYFSLKPVADDVSWRLNNYRELQNTQIAALRAHCQALNDDEQNEASDRNKVESILYPLPVNYWANYVTNMAMSCKSPVLMVSGYFDINAETREKLFYDHDDKLRDTAFDEVRW